ncbi:hypothetical protein GCM10009678_26550 [Actinomadura kijaniata]|uniref:Uncharacterized protein n=1 Tax=Actinomadura namibiensis TaxID=182080 RepID=A0A7W3QPI0_ACTNM|nr:hypothetical protein [Actinomadura namibiensis]MBA8954644.1 hypothetical protein [Actinomadura namibiensis]
MTPVDVLLSILRELFPQWDIWHERGVWRAAGFVLVSASSVDGLVEHLAGADPDAFGEVARRLAKGARGAA